MKENYNFDTVNSLWKLGGAFLARGCKVNGEVHITNGTISFITIYGLYHLSPFQVQITGILISVTNFSVLLVIP